MSCIRRTLADGRQIGFISGMGAATTDAAYGAIAGFGLTALSQLLARALWLRLVGGSFLIGLGVRAMFPWSGEATFAAVRAGALAACVSMLMSTLTDPITILAFVVASAGLGMVDQQMGARGASRLVAGVFLGGPLPGG